MNAPLPAGRPGPERRRHYREVARRIDLLIDGETDHIAILSTVVSELHNSFEAFHWTGFYRVVVPGRTLKVGPYQGGHGCLVIDFERGICGACARTGTTQLVPDVHARPEHIACSSSTLSEVVVPLVAGDALVAVLDIDSDLPAAFDEVDAEELERICARVGAALLDSQPGE